MSKKSKITKEIIEILSEKVDYMYPCTCASCDLTYLPRHVCSVYTCYRFQVLESLKAMGFFDGFLDFIDGFIDNN